MMRYPSGFCSSIVALMESETMSANSHLQIVIGCIRIKERSCFLFNRFFIWRAKLARTVGGI